MDRSASQPRNPGMRLRILAGLAALTVALATATTGASASRPRLASFRSASGWLVEQAGRTTRHWLSRLPPRTVPPHIRLLSLGALRSSHAAESSSGWTLPDADAKAFPPPPPGRLGSHDSGSTTDGRDSPAQTSSNEFGFDRSMVGISTSASSSRPNIRAERYRRRRKPNSRAYFSLNASQPGLRKHPSV
jgi:hypothetical protein